MAEMNHFISVEARPEQVYEALTSQAGLSQWWTRDTQARPETGSLAQFGFDERNVLFKMRIQELNPPRRVVWECLGEPEEWKDTRLVWKVSVNDDQTDISLTHSGWKSVTPFFASCNSTWGELMYRLKDYLEGRNPGPHWQK